MTARNKKTSMSITKAVDILEALSNYLAPRLGRTHCDLVQAELDAFIPTAPRSIRVLHHLLRGSAGVTPASIKAYLDAVGHSLLSEVSDSYGEPSSALTETRFGAFSPADRQVLFDLVNAGDTRKVHGSDIAGMMLFAVDEGDFAFFQRIPEVRGCNPELFAAHVIGKSLLGRLPVGAGDFARHILETYDLEALGVSAIDNTDFKALALVIGAGWTPDDTLRSLGCDPAGQGWGSEFLRHHPSAHARMKLRQVFQEPEAVLAMTTPDLRIALCGPLPDTSSGS